jgi:hypothetical protein
MVGRLQPVRSMIANLSKISSSQITIIFLVDGLPSGQAVDFYIPFS